MRRARAVLVAVLLVAGGAAPAAEGQQAPSLGLDPAADQAGTSGSWTITVSGRGFRPGAARPVTITFAGAVVRTAVADNGGAFSVTITPARRTAGSYPVVAAQEGCAQGGPCPVTATATFRALPQLTVEPACHGPGATAASVRGNAFAPGRVVVTVEAPSSPSRTVTADEGGRFSVTMPAVAGPGELAVTAEDSAGNRAGSPWPACPPTATTATTATTVAPGATTTTPAVPASTTTTTTSPAPAAPSLAPGATVGPPGFVVTARGQGFPPGPVTVSWDPGVGSVATTAGPDGSFSVAILVMPGDGTGPRALVASGSGVSARAPFLVAPRRGQPAGTGASRRFIGR